VPLYLKNAYFFSEVTFAANVDAAAVLSSIETVMKLIQMELIC
jgi:hypothetical protein